MQKRYNNYHKHDHISNIFTPDTNVKCKDYIERIKELGHDTYFTTNHGSGGDVFEALTLCQANEIHCKFGIEAYIVENPLEKDNRNYHIVIIPRTNTARKKINIISSHANTKGFYYKPRVFIDELLNLDKDDIYITTACVAGLLRDENSIEKIFTPLFNHFKENIFLEVQNHKDEKQIEINKKCLDFKEKYGLRLIASNDSHYIYPEQAKERLELLRGKGINYPDEDTFILDYPDYDTFFNRFKEQGILSDKEITEAIDNTLIFDECEDIDINKEIKMPDIYPHLSPTEKVVELKKHIINNFKQIIKDENIPKDKIQTYLDGIKEELKTIYDTREINTADYFLFNEKMVDLAINKYGGVLTRTGRGSCGSFYINRILGMTQLDRFSSKIKLYPERFMSTARLLENRALPDIDYNIVSQEPFVKASKELLGEHGCYPMIAYGTMKMGEAFRNVCRSKKIPYDEYNEVAKNIENYTDDEKWKPLIDEANKYVGTIISASVHPCAFCLDNKDLTEEYGVVKIGDNICCMITSMEADEYKILKDDFLIVVVWKLISETFELIGKPIISVKELLDVADDKLWDIFKNGLTCTLNQVDSDWATSLVKDYAPRNEAEMSMFVASIRPSFDSWRDKYIARESYSTGSDLLDEVLSSTSHYILFQENLMQYFEWLGVTPAESIGLIKKISKKKIKQSDFDNLADRLKKKWIENTGSIDMFDNTWNMVQSCMSYSFCSAHGLATAIDSMYGAYLKANYPHEYYTVALDNYSDDIERTHRLTKELEYFNIKILPPKFRYSKGGYTLNKETNSIYKGVGSIKFLNSDVADTLYNMKDTVFDSFIDFLKVNPCNSRQLEILIKLGYFSEFGKSEKLMKLYELFDKYNGKSQMSKAKLSELELAIIPKYAKETKTLYKFNDLDGYVKELSETIEDKELPLTELLSAQAEYLGYIDVVIPKFKDRMYILDIDVKYSPKITAYKIDTGETITIKMNKKAYASSNIEKGCIIACTIFKKHKMKKVEDKWVQLPETEDWIDNYIMVSRPVKEDENE